VDPVTDTRAPEALIELSELTLAYPGGPRAVDRLSVTVARGEILALLGPSGCGKTTTLRLIAGFERPDAGRIAIGGRTVAGPGVFVPPDRRGVGIVVQDHALFPHLSVRDNVGFGLFSWTSADRARRVAEVLDLVALHGLADRQPHELSGGQQQRVAVARALAPAPAVMLLDEPFSNLDADLRAQIREDISRILRYTSTTTIFVTHDQEEAFALADRVGVLNQGRLEQLDRPERVYHVPATPFVARFVGEADFLQGVITLDQIRTELGDFPKNAGIPAGGPVEVMIRPDDIDFVPDEHGDAMVAGRRFRGSNNVYRLCLPSGAVVHSIQSSTTIYPIGQRVQVSARLVHVIAYPVECERDPRGPAPGSAPAAAAPTPPSLRAGLGQAGAAPSAGPGSAPARKEVVAPGGADPGTDDPIAAHRPVAL
jgi:iron(III) transport system ATP-binding protein